MTPDVLLDTLREQELTFQAPELLWALLALPALMLVYAFAWRSRRRAAGAFRVTRPSPPSPSTGGRGRGRPHAVWRTLALILLFAGLAALVVGFARPEIPRPTPSDRATIVLVLDASVAMRATDVEPTRFEAAKAAARAAIAAIPKRLQVAVVAYSQSAYVVEPPTHDHGAAVAALNRIRTSDGAAAGDALAVAVAVIPHVQADTQVSGGAPGGQPGSGVAPSQPPGPGGPAGGEQPPKVPAAIVLLASGEMNAGRPLFEGALLAREASVPIYVVPMGPQGGQELKAPFDPAALRQVAQGTGGRVIAGGSREWRNLFQGFGSAVVVQVRPQEIGQYIGGGALLVIGLAMAISLAATRRPL